MRTSFTATFNPARVVFGPGMRSRLPDEIRRVGGRRALVLSTPSRKHDAERLAGRLGELAAGVFGEAAMHTPVVVAERAVKAFEQSGADCVVSIGGGSTIGLGRAMACRNDTPQVVLATTYAGSEVTPILGQTDKGLKTTIRGPEILPEAVIYDPELTVGLPIGISVTSGLNAIAHAVEALYARDRNPASSLMAVEGKRALRDALPVIVRTPADLAARTSALYGSWLCGTVLGTVGMALHHKLCHTLSIRIHG